MVKLNLNKCAPCTQHDAFFISLKCMYVCAHKISDVEALVQCTHVHTRCVYNNLHYHTCMSVAYRAKPCLHAHCVYMNCKPTMTVQTLLTCCCTKAWL